MKVKSAKLKLPLDNVVIEFESYNGEHIEFRFTDGGEWSQPGFSISQFSVGEDGYRIKGTPVRTMFVHNEWDFKRFVERLFLDD